MCLIAWNWQPGSATPLLLLANRDEFYARAALPLHWWEGGQVLAGRDLQAGGSWLGLDRKGRLAALTNYRLPTGAAAPRPSRGALVADFLQGEQDAADYLADLLQKVDNYNPFNLLLFDGRQLLGLESRHRRVLELPAGVGGVSNADFNTPWPKLQRLKSALQQQCQTGRLDSADLLPLLQDKTLATDAELPHTGVALELERTLSATFVASELYGTRVSSIVRLDDGKAGFLEQGYDARGRPTSTQQFFTP